MFCRNPSVAIEKKNKEKLRKANLKEVCGKILKASIHQHITQFWYQTDLSFNLVKIEKFSKYD